MRKASRGWISAVLAMILALTLQMTALAAPIGLPDVHGTPYERPAMALFVLNVIRGDDQGLFNPTATMKRVEAAAMVIRSVGRDSIAEGLKGSTPFPDVAASYWGSGYLNLAARENILKGFDDGSAKPETSVTYAQVVTMLVRALGIESQVTGTWPEGHLALARADGLTEGVSMAADAAITRGDVARLCYNAIFKVAGKDGSTVAKSIYGADDDGIARVDFMDVGQGGAVLIQTPDGQAILVDGGPEGQGAAVLEYLSAVGVTRIDVAIVPHPDVRLIGGLGEVIEQIPTGAVYDVRSHAGTLVYYAFPTAAGDTRLVWATGGSIPIGDEGTCEIVSPHQLADDANASSVVLRVSFGDFDFLLVGDLTAAGEAELLRKGAPLEAEVLHVGHYGSSTSRTSAFLQQVDPETAVIGVGQGNPYGQPTATTLANLQACGATVYRTDLNGSVAIYVLGNAFKVLCEGQ